MRLLLLAFFGFSSCLTNLRYQYVGPGCHSNGTGGASVTALTARESYKRASTPLPLSPLFLFLSSLALCQ